MYYKIQDNFLGEVYFTNVKELNRIIIEKYLNEETIKDFFNDAYINHSLSNSDISERSIISGHIFSSSLNGNFIESLYIDTDIKETTPSNYEQKVEMKVGDNFIDSHLFTFKDTGTHPYDNDVLINDILIKFKKSLIGFFDYSLYYDELFLDFQSMYHNKSELMFTFSNPTLKSIIVNVSDFNTLINLGIMKGIPEREYKLNFIRHEFD